MSTDAPPPPPGDHSTDRPDASAVPISAEELPALVGAGPARGAGGIGARVLQVVGFLIGVGLMAWCLHAAYSSPEKRQQLGRLLEAPLWQIALLLALSVGAVAVDGLFFRAVLRPVKRLGVVTMLGVSGVSSALSYLPFKMSMLFRIVYHTRRDGMTVVDVLAWIGATGVLLLISLVPIAGMAAAWPMIAGEGSTSPGGAVWWGGLAVLVLGGALAVNLGCRWLRWSGLAVRIASRLPGRRMTERALEALTMLADGRAVAEGIVLRGAITGMQMGRFALAAHMVGVPVTAAEALIAGGAYNLIQAISPGGVAGFREAGATAALRFMQGPEILAATLTVSAMEATVNLLMGVWGGVTLRVDRLLVRSVGSAGASRG